MHGNSIECLGRKSDNGILYSLLRFSWKPFHTWFFVPSYLLSFGNGKLARDSTRFYWHRPQPEIPLCLSLSVCQSTRVPLRKKTRKSTKMCVCVPRNAECINQTDWLRSATMSTNNFCIFNQSKYLLCTSWHGTLNNLLNSFRLGTDFYIPSYSTLF